MRDTQTGIGGGGIAEVVVEERQHLAFKPCIAVGGLAESGRAILKRETADFEEERRGPAVQVPVGHVPGPGIEPESSRRSHARATVQSPSAARFETPRRDAICSIVIPLKMRRSTTS